MATGYAQATATKVNKDGYLLVSINFNCNSNSTNFMKYRNHEYTLILHGNWWNVTVDDNPCLETFDSYYAAESAAKSIIDDLENSRFEPTIRGFPVSMLSSHPFIQDLTQVVPELKALIHEDALIGVHFPAQSSAVFTFKQSANTEAVATKLINLGYSVSIA